MHFAKSTISCSFGGLAPRDVLDRAGHREQSSAIFTSEPSGGNPMKLRRNQYCPIHRSLFCCGRETIQRIRRANPLGVQRIEDPNHPRGYRELRSNAEMRRLVNLKVVEQDRECALCHVKFTDYNDIVPDHINPRGMGGSWRDDHPNNIQAVHWWCKRGEGIEQSLK
jgi:hypothetical protein